MRGPHYSVDCDYINIAYYLYCDKLHNFNYCVHLLERKHMKLKIVRDSKIL